MNHLEFTRFVRECEKICSKHLHLDYYGKPSFDGDNSDDAKAQGKNDGYSLDELADLHDEGKTPQEVKDHFFNFKRGK